MLRQGKGFETEDIKLNKIASCGGKLGPWRQTDLNLNLTQVFPFMGWVSAQEHVSSGVNAEKTHLYFRIDILEIPHPKILTHSNRYSTNNTIKK